MTPDPIGLTGGINLYVYAGANPINAIDPYGLEAIVEWDLPTLPSLLPPWNPSSCQLGNCGSDPLDRAFIPDRWGDVSFSGACQGHDQCYDDPACEIGDVV